MITRFRKRWNGKRRLQAAIQRQASRINPYWTAYLPDGRFTETDQIIRNVRRLERLQQC